MQNVHTCPGQGHDVIHRLTTRHVYNQLERGDHLSVSLQIPDIGCIGVHNLERSWNLKTANCPAGFWRMMYRSTRYGPKLEFRKSKLPTAEPPLSPQDFPHGWTFLWNRTPDLRTHSSTLPSPQRSPVPDVAPGGRTEGEAVGLPPGPGEDGIFLPGEI